MDNIIVRYVYKDTRTGEITTECHNLYSIANSKPGPENPSGYNVIIARDLGIGIQDEDGKEIFENDIIRYSSEDGDFYMGQISYEEDDSEIWIGFKCKSIKVITDEVIDDNGDMLKDWDGNLQVVGNIYKNPELLKRSLHNGNRS